MRDNSPLGRLGFKFFILDGRKVRQVKMLEWAGWLEQRGNQIKLDTIGDATVSTVFLGCWMPPTPYLFETIIFGGKHDRDQRRYRTLEEAEAGHDELCAKVRGLH